MINEYLANRSDARLSYLNQVGNYSSNYDMESYKYRIPFTEQATTTLGNIGAAGTMGALETVMPSMLKRGRTQRWLSDPKLYSQIEAFAQAPTQSLWGRIKGASPKGVIQGAGRVSRGIRPKGVIQGIGAKARGFGSGTINYAKSLATGGPSLGTIPRAFKKAIRKEIAEGRRFGDLYSSRLNRVTTQAAKHPRGIMATAKAGVGGFAILGGAYEAGAALYRGASGSQAAIAGGRGLLRGAASGVAWEAAGLASAPVFAVNPVAGAITFGALALAGELGIHQVEDYLTNAPRDRRISKEVQMGGRVTQNKFGDTLRERSVKRAAASGTNARWNLGSEAALFHR